MCAELVEVMNELCVFGVSGEVGEVFIDLGMVVCMDLDFEGMCYYVKVIES